MPLVAAVAKVFIIVGQRGGGRKKRPSLVFKQSYLMSEVLRS